MKIYDGNINDITDFDTKKFLKINSCAFNNRTAGYTVIRKKGRHDYHLMLVSGGELKVRYGEKDYILTEGNMFIYEPGIPHYYESLTKSSTLWLHFAGTAVEEILSEMEIPLGVHKTNLGAAAFETFLKMVRQFNQPTSQKFAYGTLMTLFALISDEIHNKKLPEKSEIIWDILTYININYEQKLSLEKLAELSGYSKSRFSHLFSEVTGTTPMLYQCGVRLQNACEMLTSAEYSIKDIAQCCGFDDALYFCRVFKKRYGISPSKYRLRNSGN